MATQKTSVKGRSGTRGSKVAAVGSSSLLFHRVSTLLHTMRCIAKHEDELCVLMQALKGIGAIRLDIRQDLGKLLEKIPAHEYAVELDAVLEELDESAHPSVAVPLPHQMRTKTPKKSVKMVGRRLKKQG